MSESEEERDFEEQLRELLTEDAYTIRPSPVPYPQIRRKGVVERRRRVAVAGAVLATLAAVPVGAFAVGGGGTGTADTATTPTASASATPTPTPTPSPTPSGPAGPATAGQLRDGITLEQAVEGLDKCLAWDRQNVAMGARDSNLGKADEYRIILALNSTGDLNSPGDGIFVVAVKEKPTQTQLVCNIKNGEASGLGTSVGSDRQPDSPPVLPDSSSNKLYQQSFMNKGNWKLPFSWGFIGTVDPTVAKVTVSYGGAESEAVLDHGWFVASGTLTREVTRNPHIKGYDKGGKLIYDSDEDKTYQQVQ
ncbi:hypothetical protein [Streptomyces canus]|uniref:Uncharacterized protein n=1 Tax=Streptomyces canus TaxID=58343 RepID=A0AAW8FKL0_9ACTN|nr:hypothetical protein [Streptomyces canus]MDQ0760695.1 hypothetical protein [Streptomyces canus]MDQ0910656.1 hypothetical protein [Streptomyces canus]